MTVIRLGTKVYYAVNGVVYTSHRAALEALRG